MNQLKSFEMLVIALLVFAGCAQDRSVNDYKRDEFQKNLDELKDVEGIYSGVLQKYSNGEEIGRMELSLMPTPRPTTDVAAPRAQLRGKLEFSGNNLTKLVFQESAYDPERQELYTSIPVPDGNASARSLDLEAKLENGKLIGRLSNFGFEDEGAKFVLEKVPAATTFSPADIVKDRQIENIDLLLSGKASFSNGRTDETFLTISNDEMPIERRFIDMLSPQKTVRVDLTIPDIGDTLVFNNADFRPATREISASGMSGGPSPSQVSLSCQADNQTEVGYRCRYTSSLGARLDIHLEPVARKL